MQINSKLKKNLKKEQGDWKLKLQICKQKNCIANRMYNCTEINNRGIKCLEFKYRSLKIGLIFIHHGKCLRSAGVCRNVDLKSMKYYDKPDKMQMRLVIDDAAR